MAENSEKGSSIQGALLATGLIFLAATAALVAAHHINHSLLSTPTVVEPKPLADNSSKAPADKGSSAAAPADSSK